jgi:3-oxoacyl-[acyl-carrier protein] reductase
MHGRSLKSQNKINCSVLRPSFSPLRTTALRMTTKLSVWRLWHMSDLKNRVALVTGGSRGIGEAIAIALAKAGAAVAVNYRERSQEAAAVVENIQRNGGRAAAIAADVSLAGAVRSMISDVESRLGPIDILVNNAGIALTRGLDEITEEDFDRTVAVNLKSAFLCTQAVLAGMRGRGWGRIVNISSIAGRGAGSISVAYNASKAGLEGLTRGYASRLAPEGVTVNAVAPGLIDTEMGRPLIEAGVIARIPVGRSGTGEEIAQAVMLLVRDGYITGQTLAVNGGGLFS